MKLGYNKINQKEKTTPGLPIKVALQNSKGSKQAYKLFLEKLLKEDIKSFEEYFKAIEKAGYKLSLHKTKDTGALRGYGIAKNGTYLDSSTIDRKLTLKNVTSIINNNIKTSVSLNKHKTFDKDIKTPKIKVNFL